jgi:hypothetical protein
VVAPFNPPVSGEDFIFYASLSDMSTPGSFKSSPTIAAGDFKVSKDGGALANLATIPAVAPAASVMVKFTLSAAEMTADNVTIVGVDQTTTKEWADFCVNIVTTV